MVSLDLSAASKYFTLLLDGPAGSIDLSLLHVISEPDFSEDDCSFRDDDWYSRIRKHTPDVNGGFGSIFGCRIHRMGVSIAFGTIFY